MLEAVLSVAADELVGTRWLAGLLHAALGTYLDGYDYSSSEGDHS